MTKGRMIIIGVLIAGALATPACRAAGAQSTAGPRGDTRADTHNLLREVRRATMAYKDVRAAEAAGYVPAGPCAEDPKYGGMGIHYENLRSSRTACSTRCAPRCSSTSRRRAGG